MKKYSLGLILLLSIQWGCTGSGAVNPITPKNSTLPDSSTSADSDVVYWTTYPVTFVLSDPLNGVCLISKKLGWACGNNGTVLKYDGETWARVDPGYAKTENLQAVAFANENEGWFVGGHGTILHYNNGNWNLEDSQTQESLNSVAVTRSQTVWVVGTNGTILTYNGVSWGKIVAASSTSNGTPVTVTQDLNSVGLADQNNGWAVGSQGTILRYDGQKWLPFTSPSTEKLNSVSVVNSVQAWIVGAFGTILNFNGTTWNKQGTASSGLDLYQIFMKDENNGWAVGQDGTIIYYDGSRWINHVKPETKPSLNAVTFYKDLGFMVGSNGAILKFQPNGEPAKFSFLFKGEASKKPAKANPYWTITYTLMNQSPKTSPFLTFQLPIPKGFEPYQKKDTPTPTPGIGVPAAPVSTTPSPTATPTVAGSPSASPGVGAKPTPSSDRSSTAVTGNWKMKDNNLVWEIGTVSSSELKTLIVLFQDKKGEKKEYPVLLKGVLSSTDKVIAEAAAVTVLSSERTLVSPQEMPTPKTIPTLKRPTPVSTPGEPVSTPAVGSGDNPPKDGSANAKPTPASGN